MRALLVITACIAWSLAGVAGAEQYAVPGLGAVHLEVPKGLRVQERPAPTSIYLLIRPETGDGYALQLTSMWMQPDGIADFAASPVKGRVERMAADLLPEAVEREAPLSELSGRAASGYYFSITSRRDTSGPGQYKHLTQGMLVHDQGAMLFTLLYREPDFADRKALLQMLAGARHSRDSSSPVPLEQDSLRIDEKSNRFDLWLAASRIYMTLPRGKLVRVTNPLGGAANHPRYFYFNDRGFNVSGWFEPAEKFRGVEKFWEGERAVFGRRGLPEPVDVAFKQVAGWDVIAYDQPVPGGTSSHFRAQRVQSGTWIDLHLSLTSDRPASTIRDALETYLKGVLVRER